LNEVRDNNQDLDDNEGHGDKNDEDEHEDDKHGDDEDEDQDEAKEMSEEFKASSE